MNQKNVMIKAAFAAFVLMVGSNVTANAEMQTPPDLEKCYGISKAGKNDCGAGSQSCAGSAKKDSQGDAFLFVPKGLCERIVGGSLTKK